MLAGCIDSQSLDGQLDRLADDLCGRKIPEVLSMIITLKLMGSGWQHSRVVAMGMKMG